MADAHLLAAVLGGAPEPALLIDPDGRSVLWSNWAARDLLGDVIHASVAPDIPDLVLPLVPRRADGARTGQGPATARRCVTCRGRDGRLIEAEATCWPLHDQQGRVSGHALLLRDVTEDRRLVSALRQLHEISSDQSLTGERRIESILSLGMVHFDLPVAIVSMIRDDTYTVLSARSDLFYVPPGTRFDLGRTFCRDTVARDAPLAIPDATLTEPGGHPAWREFGLRAYVGVPLKIGGDCIGTLSFSGPRERAYFSCADLDLATLFAAWIAQELGLQRHIQELSEMATLDWLTGALGRRSFEADLADAFHATQGTAAQPHLVILDLDHFKTVNDRFGHDCGDRTLRHLAGTLRDIAGPDLPLYRIGGEEFALIPTGHSASEVDALADTLRCSVAGATRQGDVAPLPLTVSVGIAARSPAMDEPRDWFRAADTALYRAKTAGRDRVRRHDGLTQIKAGAGTP